jgi:hypothetical protein
MSEPTKVPLRSSRIGRGPLNSGITPGLRHGAVVTCTECAVGVIDHPSGGVSAPVPSAWFWQVKRAGTKAGAVGCVLAPDSTSVPLPTLVRALVPLIVPENVVSCCRCRPPACPGLIVVTANTCAGQHRHSPGLGEAKGSRMPAAAARAGLVGVRVDVSHCFRLLSLQVECFRR